MALGGGDKTGPGGLKIQTAQKGDASPTLPTGSAAIGGPPSYLSEDGNFGNVPISDDKKA